jgi:hypothetical protein
MGVMHCSMPSAAAIAGFALELIEIEHDLAKAVNNINFFVYVFYIR